MLLPLIDRITETPPCTDRDLARMRLADLRVNLSGSPLA